MKPEEFKLILEALLANGQQVESTREKTAREGEAPFTPIAELRLLKSDEVATMLQVPRARVYELVKRHHLPSVQIGRTIRFDRRAVEAWIADQMAA